MFGTPLKSCKQRNNIGKKIQSLSQNNKQKQKMHGHSVEKKIKNSAKSDMYMYVYIRNSNRNFFLKKETSDSTEHIIAHFHFKFKQWAVQYMHYFLYRPPFKYI